MKVWIKALRVSQWTKNVVVFAAWFFAVADASQAAMARGWRPFALVCAMAIRVSACGLIRRINRRTPGFRAAEDRVVRRWTMGLNGYGMGTTVRPAASRRLYRRTMRFRSYAIVRLSLILFSLLCDTREQYNKG